MRWGINKCGVCGGDIEYRQIWKKKKEIKSAYRQKIFTLTLRLIKYTGK